MRAAVVGIGRIGHSYTIGSERASHVSSYLKCPETELVAVADVDRVKLEDFKIEHTDIAVYQDYEKMLNEAKPEIVSVCTPTETHARIARNCARFASTKALFVEKPISSTVEEAEKMIKTCEQFGVKLACNMARRWDKAYQRIKRIADGQDETWDIGELLAFEGRFSGDPIGDGVHMADLHNWMMQENTKLSLLNIPSPYLVFEADLWGSNGLVRILNNGSEIQLWFAEESRRYQGFRELGGMITLEETYDFPQAMLNAVDDLVECASSDKQPECDGKCGLETLKLCLERFGLK